MGAPRLFVAKNLERDHVRVHSNWIVMGWIVASIGLATGCTPRKVEPVEAPAPEVTAAYPVAKPVTEFYEYIGRTKSPQFVEVRSRVSGCVKKIHVTDGKEVQVDDPLFEIDLRPYQYALDAAIAKQQQADASFRRTPVDIGKLQVRNQNNEMVPLATLVDVRDTSGPGIVYRFNMYPSAYFIASPTPGEGTGDAIQLMEGIAQREFPSSMSFE